MAKSVFKLMNQNKRLYENMLNVLQVAEILKNFVIFIENYKKDNSFEKAITKK
jgi:hypothetical protein